MNKTRETSMSQQRQRQKNNPLFYLFKKRFEYAESKFSIIGLWTMFVVAEGLDVILEPYIWSQVILIISGEGITATSIEKLYMLLSLYLVKTIVFWSIHGPARLMEQAQAFHTRTKYRGFLLKGLLTLGLNWHTERHSGDIIDRTNRGVAALHEFSEDSFQVIYAFVRLVMSYIMLVVFARSASWIALVLMIVSVWITLRFDRVLIRQYGSLNEKENKISESIFDAISNIGTVIILRVEKLIFDSIMNKVQEPFELSRYTYRLNEWKWALTSFCCALMTVLVFGVYFRQNIGMAPGVLVANVYLLISYLNKVGELFFSFTSMYGGIVKRKARVENSESLSVDFKSDSLTNHVLPENWHRLSVSGLIFSYGNSEKHHRNLDDISFSCVRGERIALVGRTGSGKSTFLKVMRGLFQPQSISLRVDGKRVSEGFDGICRAISLLPQDPEIFATTIKENITLGADHPIRIVEKYADLACFTEVASRLLNGFNSSIRERGVNLSGGEQQRLALARGFLASEDKDIVLLDEPTSSLDAATQLRVYQNIFRYFHGKTVISTVHQLSLLPLFDHIYVFNMGRVVGAGSLQELLASCSEFQELYRD